MKQRSPWLSFKICSQTRGQRRWKANWPDFILKYCRQEVRISSTVFSSFWYQKFCPEFMSIFCSKLFSRWTLSKIFLFGYSVSNIWLNWRNFPAKKLWKIQAPKIRMRRFFYFSYSINKGYFQVACLFFNKHCNVVSNLYFILINNTSLLSLNSLFSSNIT